MLGKRKVDQKKKKEQKSEPDVHYFVNEPKHTCCAEQTVQEWAMTPEALLCSFTLTMVRKHRYIAQH